MGQFTGDTQFPCAGCAVEPAKRSSPDTSTFSVLGSFSHQHPTKHSSQRQSVLDKDLGLLQMGTSSKTGLGEARLDAKAQGFSLHVMCMLL